MRNSFGCYHMTMIQTRKLGCLLQAKNLKLTCRAVDLSQCFGAFLVVLPLRPSRERLPDLKCQLEEIYIMTSVCLSTIYK